MNVTHFDNPEPFSTVHDPLIVCGDRHRAYFEPRPLCAVDSVVTDWQLTPLLEIVVSACSPDVSGSPSPALVIVHGELDSYAASKIHDTLHDYARFAAHVVLDLSSVSLIDSGGVVLIHNLHRSLRRRRGSLMIHDPSIMVERVLEICGATATIPLCRPTPMDGGRQSGSVEDRLSG